MTLWKSNFACFPLITHSTHISPLVLFASICTKLGSREPLTIVKSHVVFMSVFLCLVFHMCIHKKAFSHKYIVENGNKTAFILFQQGVLIPYF
jgi:hypothetical protein